MRNEKVHERFHEKINIWSYMFGKYTKTMLWYWSNEINVFHSEQLCVRATAGYVSVVLTESLGLSRFVLHIYCFI